MTFTISHVRVRLIIPVVVPLKIDVVIFSILGIPPFKSLNCRLILDHGLVTLRSEPLRLVLAVVAIASGGGTSLITWRLLASPFISATLLLLFHRLLLVFTLHRSFKLIIVIILFFEEVFGRKALVGYILVRIFPFSTAWALPVILVRVTLAVTFS